MRVYDVQQAPLDATRWQVCRFYDSGLVSHCVFETSDRNEAEKMQSAFIEAWRLGKDYARAEIREALGIKEED